MEIRSHQIPREIPPGLLSAARLPQRVPSLAV
jgi:hypothetical protein